MSTITDECDDDLGVPQSDRQLDIHLCLHDPGTVISESELSPSDIDPPVFYHENNDMPVVKIFLEYALREVTVS